MKINKQKHGKENTIGKIIYGFLMFMPLLAIAVTCAYVIFNKNAYQSYSGTDNTSISNYENVSDIPLETPIYSYLNANVTFNNTGYFGVQNVNILATNGTLQNNNFEDIKFLRFYDTKSILASDINYNQIFNINVASSIYINLEYEMLSKPSSLTSIGTMFSYVNENSFSKIDNVFYYSIDKVEQSPLFNWATETGTHNVLESTCQTLGITTTFIPMLLAYWLMMSLMYLLYDIALLIVHMAHNRIHDIESSI